MAEFKKKTALNIFVLNWVALKGSFEQFSIKFLVFIYSYLKLMLIEGLTICLLTKNEFVSDYKNKVQSILYLVVVHNY